MLLLLRIHNHTAIHTGFLKRLHDSGITTTSTSETRYKSIAMNDTALLEVTRNNINLVYFHAPVNVLFMTMPKAGTSTLWHWLYPGVTSVTTGWDSVKCGGHVHDMQSPCWKGYASYVHTLPISEQRRILTSSSSKHDDVLRVAIQRDPYDRLVSSFKSKFTCEDSLYGTDVKDRASLVPILRKRCGTISSSASQNNNTVDCMTVSEFARTLDACRNNVGKLSGLPSLDVLDVHIRPQTFHFDRIAYDMIIDVSALSDGRVLKPIVDRLPFRDVVKAVPKLRHQSTTAQSSEGGVDRGELMIGESAAKLLHAFARLSGTGSLKYLEGAEPSSRGESRRR